MVLLCAYIKPRLLIGWKCFGKSHELSHQTETETFLSLEETLVYFSVTCSAYLCSSCLLEKTGKRMVKMKFEELFSW